ncbi:MAG: carboxypeptidase-like regulatory domain-containing protein [Pyrinomonadaceae bacterium]
MRKALRVGLALFALSALCGVSAPAVLGNSNSSSGSGRGLATITGSVRDNKGKPLAGAAVELLREGASEVIKQVRSAADGTFSAKINPGRYSLRATASGFNQALFNAVQVRASDELVYRFNLEPVGSGRTAPERRRDREDPKWRLRSAQGRRSIFQMQEDDADAIVAAALGIETETAEELPEGADGIPTRAEGRRKARRMQGVVETFVATSSSPLAPAYAGVNFAFAKPFNDRIDFIFAGQAGIGTNAPQRLEMTARVRANERHRLSIGLGGTRIAAATPLLPQEAVDKAFGQLSVRAVDEWIVRDGVVIVLGVDYARFFGAGQSAQSISPRLGVQFDANARTRLKAAYTPGDDAGGIQSVAEFEDEQIIFKQAMSEPVAFVDGQAVMERSRRFEFGVERVLDNQSSVEATAFFDTTSGRGVGLFSMPLNAFSNENGAALLSVANQEGAARGMRVVYTRRISRILSASAGYSFGRGQQLSAEGLSNPAELFVNGFFQTAAMQLSADLPTGTRVRTVFRFSPGATVFAIDPFAGRLAVFDPSLSILVTQDLPTFGLPVRAEAVIDARNLLDTQASTDDGELLMFINGMRRSVRGGISVRF